MQKRSKGLSNRQLTGKTGPQAGKRVWIGVDLGDRWSHVCILDDAGEVVQRTRIRTTPEAMRGEFTAFAGAAIVIEASGDSPWVSRLLKECGLNVTVANAREVRKIHESNRKNDRSDAEILARMLRFDPKLLAPIHHRDEVMQADIAVLRARDTLVRARTSCINAVRGLVKSQGARLPQCSSEAFVRRVAACVPRALEGAVTPLLAIIAELSTQIRSYEHRITQIAEERYPQTALLTQVTGVGPITSLGFILTLGDKERFKHSRDVGPYLGLVPRQYDSGNQQSQLQITKAGNPYLRRLLVNSAQYILGRFGPDCRLRRYGEHLMERGGRNAKKRAVVAVARKLAILLHHLWTTAAVYDSFYGIQKEHHTAA
jgi:transposase